MKNEFGQEVFCAHCVDNEQSLIGLMADEAIPAPSPALRWVIVQGELVPLCAAHAAQEVIQ